MFVIAFGVIALWTIYKLKRKNRNRRDHQEVKETSIANHDTASNTSLKDETEAKSTHWFIWVLIVGIIVLAAKRIGTLMGW